MRYDGAYFRIALLDITYGVINDGKEARVYHKEGSRYAITITTDIGVAVVMPVFIDGDPNGVVVEI
jgi:serine/threonine-protein kinase RIO1